jgi:signal transduction histidine kinase
VGEVFPSLSAAAYAAFIGQPCDLPTAVKADELLCAGHAIPVWPSERIHLLGPPPDAGGQESDYAMLINWVGRPGTFPMYSAADVLEREPGDPRLEAMFRGKVVFLGQLDDRAATPMGAPHGRPASGSPYVDQSAEITMSGIEIHANALDTMLTGRFIRPVEAWVMWVLLLGCTGLTLVAFRSVRAGGAVVVTVLEGLALVVAARVLIGRDVWLVPVTPVAAMVTTAVLSAIWGYAHATRQEVLLRRQLQEIDAATATAVHDLKQPLAAINALAGALRRLQEAGQLSAAPEILERIQRQVESALGNINEMLLTDPDRPITLNLQEFDLTAVARDLATTHALSSRLHEIAVRSPNGPAIVTADPQHVGRVLNNLIDNAIRYSPEGGPVVIEVLPGGKHTVVRVADRGLGIPPDKVHAVFDKYERVEHEGHHIPGTGIGLYSVKRLVEAHGGRIGVRSIQGVGTTFTVTLPTRAEGNGSPPG